MTTNQAADLFAALAVIPSLPGARCRGRAELFDGDGGPDGERSRQAASLCRGCPALDRCREWADSQPPRDLSGVLGGRWYAFASYESSPRRWPQGAPIAPTGDNGADWPQPTKGMT